MSRKDVLRTMLSGREERLPDGNSPAEDTSPAPPEIVRTFPHVRAGAVGAMGRSLGQIASAAEHAKALIATGSSVVEIPTDNLDGSFVSDRLESEGVDFELLVEAIKESGQRSPVLVRPHPEATDRYQIVFGHRRVRAAARLGRPVKAVVQKLTDEEVVVIQGQENSARTDLSYIERGLFAAALERRGFDRRVIMAALGMEKTQLSKLLAVTHAIPIELARAIGPAPKAGRPRWIALAERLTKASKRAFEKILSDPTFKEADSDTRFLRVYAGLETKTPVEKPHQLEWNDEGGQHVATIDRKGGRISITVDENQAPDFGDYLLTQMERLYKDFVSRRKRA
jgi:ParB family transcriptional regulator, chromosome partitioning protein